MSYVFKLPEGPITGKIYKRTADDTITTGSVPSEYKVVVKPRATMSRMSLLSLNAKTDSYSDEV